MRSRARNFALGHHLFDTSHGLGYLYIAKNACTFLKGLYLFSDEPKRIQELSNKDSDLSPIHQAARAMSLSDKELFRDGRRSTYIAVLRNPIERFVSAYVDKFVRPKKIPSFALRSARLSSHDAAVSKLTFRTFLETIRTESYWNLNEHWMPQSRHFIRGFRYLLVSTEQIPKLDLKHSWTDRDYEDWKLRNITKRSRWGAPAGLRFEELSELRKVYQAQSTAPEVDEFLGEEEIEILKAIYAKDLKLIAKWRPGTAS